MPSNDKTEMTDSTLLKVPIKWASVTQHTAMSWAIVGAESAIFMKLRREALNDYYSAPET